MIRDILTSLRYCGHVWDILGHGWDIGGTFVGHQWDICALTWPRTCLGLVLDTFYEKNFENVLKVTENGSPVGSIFNYILSFW